MNAGEQLEVFAADRRAVVEKNVGHPEGYLWIRVDGKTFFLGVLEKNMSRRDVRAMATAWLERPAGSGRRH